MSKTNGTDELLMHQLRQILLREDREALEALKNELDDPVRLSRRVGPLIEEQIQFLKQHFPAEFRQAVDKIVEQKIRESREELLNVIYPALGVMIRKYVAHQMQMLREKVEHQIRQTTSMNRWIGKMKSMFSGVSQADLLLSAADRPVVEEVFLIERDSGLLLGSASLQPMFNREAVAGMLTAIKAFVEDAFERESQEVELVQYGDFQILMQGFRTCYIALAIRGVLSAGEKDRIIAAILAFAAGEGFPRHDAMDPEMTRQLSERLEQTFIERDKKNIPV